MTDVVLRWFADADGACTAFLTTFPSAETVEEFTLAGPCEWGVSTAPSPDGSSLLVVRAGEPGGSTQIDLVEGGVATSIEPPPGYVRHGAYTVEGVPMALIADTPDEPNRPFRVATFALEDGAWAERESVTEDRATVRAVEGGPVWQARAPGADVDAWMIEKASGFRLVDPTDVKVPKKLRMDPLFYGVVPVEGGAVAVRYTVLGVPSPVGPVFLQTGKKWRLLDDSRMLETPASVAVNGNWLLVSYEGWSPVVVDLTTRDRVWPTDPDAQPMGAGWR